MSVCSESCMSQQPVCGGSGSLVRPCWTGLPPCFQVTKLGYDADQMPLALRPRCPCCGCRQNPLHEFKISEVKRDGCAFDPCSPCDSKLYESYFESFALPAAAVGMSSCSDSQSDIGPSCHSEAQLLSSTASSSQIGTRSTQSNCSHCCSRRNRCRC
ncbi:expressed conserved protein [Echinococcus multilocularis]|uniref:Expressed conserved protein n=1 Tax=Echinococcus multilocularis TaxID=6211 RepID=A0A068Y994_ECHMU|nr:expressed conserved protein [Echinococcus multilocularis]